jgi:hypothetical protein
MMNLIRIVVGSPCAIGNQWFHSTAPSQSPALQPTRAASSLAHQFKGSSALTTEWIAAQALIKQIAFLMIILLRSLFFTLRASNKMIL